MHKIALVLLLVSCGFGLSATAARAQSIEPRVSLSQSSNDISATQKQRVRRNARPAPAAPAQRPPRGFADPSFGPDGKPYPVPEYLRNQCYIDEGYGRFSACTIIP